MQYICPPPSSIAVNFLSSRIYILLPTTDPTSVPPENHMIPLKILRQVQLTNSARAICKLHLCYMKNALVFS